MNDRLADKINDLLKTLSRGLIQGSNQEIYESHRALFEIGEVVIPVVKEQLLSQSWDEVQYSAQLNLLSGLLNLIHDIDENSARVIGREIITRGCSRIVESRVKSIINFTLEKFHTYTILGVNVYQAKELGDAGPVETRLSKWLSQVPKNDLREIERLYIVPPSNESYVGTYTPILCNIVVEWTTQEFRWPPLVWLVLSSVEHTLYHEIGHHVHRHTFGQDPDQEDEADAYAARIMRKSHPISEFVARTLRRLLGKRLKC